MSVLKWELIDLFRWVGLALLGVVGDYSLVEIAPECHDVGRHSGADEAPTEQIKRFDDSLRCRHGF